MGRNGEEKFSFGMLRPEYGIEVDVLGRGSEGGGGGERSQEVGGVDWWLFIVKMKS